jgi:glycosyltransferase involved in cell wall biosynthesis
MDFPLVSIAIITYNSSETIWETLNSVITQDYPNYEVLIFDDCSKDDTVSKIEDWKRVHSSDKIGSFGYFVFSNKQNLGVVGNSNRALKNSQGKYILFLSGDDKLYSYSLTEAVNFAEHNYLPVVFSRIEIFGDDNSWLQKEQMEKMAAFGYEMLKKDTHTQYLKLLEQSYIPGPCGSFVNREFMIDFGGYDERFPMLEDWPFFLRYMKYGYPVMLCESPMVKYRVSRKSLCQSDNPLFVKSSYDFFLLERKTALIENGRRDIAIDQETQFNNIMKKDKYHVDYYELFQWVILKQKNRHIEDFFYANNIKRIAVYGMGDIAYLLINELKDTDISIEYGIDGKCYGEFWGIHVLPIEAEFPIVDAIVVTPVVAFDSIYHDLKNRTYIKLISLEDVLFFNKG